MFWEFLPFENWWMFCGGRDGLCGDGDLRPVVGLEEGTPQIVSLGIHVGIGVAVFSMTLVFLWAISGRPSGTETAIFSLASDYVRIARRLPARPE